LQAFPLFILFLGDSLQAKVQEMKESIRNQRPTKCKVFTEIDFMLGLGLIIGAAEFSQ
jgi:hypothetical protein